MTVHPTSPGRKRCGWLRPVPRSVLIGVLALSVLAWGPAAAAAPVSPDGQAATAPYLAGLSENTFVFSGALTGTLHIDPRQDCTGAGPVGVTLTIAGQLQGSKAASWVVQVVSLNNGTYTLRPGSVIGVTVSDAAGDVQFGLAPHGQLTVAGKSGSLEADLGGIQGTQLHLVGAWDCP